MILCGSAGMIDIVDSSSDSITENSSDGTDKVYSSATFTISENVEQLILTGSSNIDGTVIHQIISNGNREIL